MILCIDPGTEQSGCVLLTPSGVVESAGMKSNAEIVMLLRSAKELTDADVLVIEMMENFGKTLGTAALRTVWWSGRFSEAWLDRKGILREMPRREVKLALCGSMRAKDPNVRASLIDLYGGEIETKKGGRLSKVKSHAWQALALGVVHLGLHKTGL